jgi:hypothetical protein
MSESRYTSHRKVYDFGKRAKKKEKLLSSRPDETNPSTGANISGVLVEVAYFIL